MIPEEKVYLWFFEEQMLEEKLKELESWKENEVYKGRKKEIERY